MRIFIVPGWYKTRKNPQNGIFFLEQAKMLQQFGHEVVMLDCTERGRRDYFASDNYRFVKKNEDGLLTYQLCYANWFLTKTPRLKRLLAKHRFRKLYRKAVYDNGKPEGVICHGFIMANNVISSNEIDSPIIVIEHSSYVLNKKLSKFQVSMLKEDVDRADAFMCVSNALKKAVLEMTEKDNKTISVIPNPVNSLFFDHSIEADHCFRFICVATINAESKGIQTLIEAFCMAFDCNEEVELLILGDGKDYNAMRDLIKKKERTNQIQMLGRVPRESVRDHMLSSDVFVLPSKYETFGIAYIEAMACGLPIITQKNGGSEQIVEPDCGILLQDPTVEDYAGAMKSIIGDISIYDREKISEKCRNLYSEKAYVSRIETLFRGFTAKRQEQ